MQGKEFPGEQHVVEREEGKAGGHGGKVSASGVRGQGSGVGEAEVP
jgi:hypothetical protein